MDTDSVNVIAPLQTACRTRTDALPVFESPISTHLAEEGCTGTEPPSYPVQQPELRRFENTFPPTQPPDENWKSHGHSNIFHWHRSIQRSGQIWHQYGISANDNKHTAKAPSHHFTCKMLPRPGYTERKVTKRCRAVAESLKLHRGPTGGKCNSCDFRNVTGSLEGCLWGNVSMSRSQFRMCMREHDEACSCGCFDSGLFAPALQSSLEINKPERNIEGKQYPTNDPSDEKWTYHKRLLGSTPGSHYARAIKRDNKIYYQYGIGKDERSQEQPEFFFTCKMEPRANASEVQVRELCRIIAWSLDFHCNHSYRKCDCNFESLRESWRSCKLSWFHLYRKFAGHVTNKAMDGHDKFCSCGCFDIQKREV